MHIKKTSAFLLAAFCALIIAGSSGCNEDAVSAAGQENDGLPKMKFHKPRNFGLAVERLREIHELIVADGELPAPITYTVVEVRHAHADGDSHVHYHLVEDGDHDHEHEDGHEHEHGHKHADDHEHEDVHDETEVTHNIRVEIFTELTDIVRWLPGIASDSDMDAKRWKQVSETSDELTSKLESITSSGDQAAQRQQYRKLADEVSASIGKLEAVVKPNAAKVL